MIELQIARAARCHTATEPAAFLDYGAAVPRYRKATCGGQPGHACSDYGYRSHQASTFGRMYLIDGGACRAGWQSA
jgi:hypothetical protein